MVEYHKDLVIAKIKQCFPGEDQGEILSVLDRYGFESHERERERVQIAILKLSEGDLTRLHKEVDVAKRDYKDVLAWAEYSEGMKYATWLMDKEKVREINKRDQKQYLDWLRS